MELTTENLIFTSADHEKTHFMGETSGHREALYRDITPGVYRMICGDLYRVVDGLPPWYKDGQT